MNHGWNDVLHLVPASNQPLVIVTSYSLRFELPSICAVTLFPTAWQGVQLVHIVKRGKASRLNLIQHSCFKASEWRECNAFLWGMYSIKTSGKLFSAVRLWISLCFLWVRKQLLWDGYLAPLRRILGVWFATLNEVGQCGLEQYFPLSHLENPHSCIAYQTDQIPQLSKTEKPAAHVSIKVIVNPATKLGVLHLKWCIHPLWLHLISFCPPQKEE